MSKLVQLQPVTYNWRSDEHPEYHFGAEQASGLIGQEVEKIFPEMVVTDERGYKMVNYSELPYLMLQAIKELKAENDSLQTEIDKLKNQEQSRIRKLESLMDELQSRLADGNHSKP